jgi:hypothetical protein
VLSKLAQYEQQLKEESEKHQQEIIKIEREHQEKVLMNLIFQPSVYPDFKSLKHISYFLNISCFSFVVNGVTNAVLK